MQSLATTESLTEVKLQWAKLGYKVPENIQRRSLQQNMSSFVSIKEASKMLRILVSFVKLAQAKVI